MTLTENIPEMPSWTVAFAFILAPLAVWLLWRLQVTSVEVLRWRLMVLLRHAPWMYHTVSWFGTFLHEMSHALVLLLSGHGIKQFSVKSDHGHVLPRRLRKGPVGFLFFLLAALAPLFGPPLLALTMMAILVDGGVWAFSSAGAGLKEALGVLETTLVQSPWILLKAIGSLDMRILWHVIALIVILFGIPGSRPSHVKGSKFHGEDDEGDVAVVRKKIRQNPWPLLAVLAIIIAAYWPLMQVAPKVYWYPFQAVWSVAVAAVVFAIFGAVWWSLIGFNLASKFFVAWIPFAAFIALQIIGHGASWSVPIVNGISFGAFAVSSVAFRFLMPRRDKWHKLTK